MESEIVVGISMFIFYYIIFYIVRATVAEEVLQNLYSYDFLINDNKYIIKYLRWV